MKQIPMKTVGSILPADPEFNGISQELMNAILTGDIALQETDVYQLAKSIANYVSSSNYYQDTGSANTYTLIRVGTFRTPNKYFDGFMVLFRPANDNTGASIINVAGLGAKSIKKADRITDVSTGDLVATKDSLLRYDGTNFILITTGNNLTGTFTGDVNADLIQTKTASGDLLIKNQGGDTIVTLKDDKDVYFVGDITAPNIFKTNFFDNGGMQVYQRAVAHTLVKDVYGFAVDRWAGMATGSAVGAGTLTQETSSTLNNTGFSAKFSNITLTGTGVLYFRQRIASQDAIKLKNKNVSLQFKVLHDAGSDINYTIYVRKADANNDFTTSTDISNSGAISVSSGAETTIKYEDVSLGDCSDGLEIEVKIECGAITTKNFEISNCKLEIGASCSDFIEKGYAEDLSNCQRYYFYANQQMFCSSLGENNGSMFLMHPYPQTMIKNPVLHVYNASNQAIDSVYVSGFGSYSVSYPSGNSAGMFVYFSALGYNKTVFGQISKFTSNAEL